MSERPAPPLSLDVVRRRWTRIVRAPAAHHRPLAEMFANPEDRDAARRVTAIANHAMASDSLPPPSQPEAAMRMAPFSALGQPSRFSDGTFGVFYAALDTETAIAETVFHSERHLRATEEDAIEFDMVSYVGQVRKPLEDLRGPGYGHLGQEAVESWPVCQLFGGERRAAGASGLLYPSARHRGGECIVAFRPNAVSVPSRDALYRYCWNGSAIHRVLTISEVRELAPFYRVA